MMLKKYSVVTALFPLCVFAFNAASAAVPSDQGITDSYEVVTVTRPAYLTEARKLEKSGYEICAITNAMLKKPIAPYPQLLEKHFETRTTYIRSGSSFFIKKESYEGDGENASSEKNCKVDMPKPKVEITVIHSGSIHLRTISGDGEVFDDVAKFPTLPYEMNDDLSLYPNRTTKAGISMRCTDTFSGTLSCIYDDGHGGTLLDNGVPKKPLEIYVDTSQLQGLLRGVLTTTEVVSLQVNKKNDPNIFVLTTRSK